MEKTTYTDFTLIEVCDGLLHLVDKQSNVKIVIEFLSYLEQIGSQHPDFHRVMVF